jgi:NADH:ubiquinone reductase (H+-translocating)
MAGGALGIPLWGLISVVAIPVLSGHQPEWDADQMRGHFPALVCWVIYGAVLGLLTQALNDFANWVWGPEVTPDKHDAQEKTRVVILGGGCNTANANSASAAKHEAQQPSNPSSVLVCLITCCDQALH